MVLLTDRVTSRPLEDGETFGIDGVKHAIEEAASCSAVSTAMASQQAFTNGSQQPFEDDATVVVMVVA